MRLGYAALLALTVPACALVLGVEELPQANSVDAGGADAGDADAADADAADANVDDADAGDEGGADSGWMPGPCDCPATQAWSKAFAVTGDVTVAGVAVDADDRVIIAGSLAGELHVDGQVLGGGADHDVFVVVLGPCGDLVWARRYGDAAEQSALAIAVDPATTSHPNAIVLSGVFAGDLGFGGGAAVLTAPNQRAFVARLDPATGDGIAALGAGSDPAKIHRGTSVAVAADGSAFWAGTEDSGATLFVRRFDDDLAVTHQITPACLQCDPSIALMPDGGVAVAGGFEGSVDFVPGGPGGLNSSGGSDLYIATLAPLAPSSFVEVKVKRYGDAAAQAGAGVATDAAGNIAVVGSFAGAMTIAMPELLSNGALDAFAALTDLGLKPTWSFAFGGGGLVADQRATAVALRDGALAVVGDFASTLALPSPLTSAGDADVFLLRLNPATGMVEHSESFGGAGTDHGAGVAIDGRSNAIVAGVLDGEASFGCGVLGGDGKSLFVVKRNPP